LPCHKGWGTRSFVAGQEIAFNDTAIPGLAAEAHRLTKKWFSRRDTLWFGELVQQQFRLGGQGVRAVGVSGVQRLLGLF
jgi:hypothetical protein